VRTIRSALVTGATGFIGSALVRRLVAEGVDVFCLLRETSKSRAVLDSFPDIHRLEVPSFDTPCLTSRLTGVSAEVVFHLASYGVDQDDRDSDAMLDGNVGLVARMVSATAHWPLQRFIHTGSCAEYGAPLSRELPLTETQPLRPLSIYGAAKAASVLYATALATRLNIPLVTLRLFGVFGVGERPRRLVPYLVHRLQSNEPVDLTPGEQVRDVLYVDDVVDAFLAAARSDGLPPHQVYNVCSGKAVTVRELGELVARVMGKSETLLHWGQRPYRADEPMCVVGSNEKFTRATDWRPRTPLEEGVRRAVEAIEDQQVATQP